MHPRSQVVGHEFVSRKSKWQRASRIFCGFPDFGRASDITYIQTNEGWSYLAVVLDLCSRQVVGWSMQPHVQTSLVMDALKMAWFRRRPETGLIFHSDSGGQHCSHTFQDALAEYGMQSSMSRKDNCWDNAPTESLWGSLKVGKLYGMRFEARRQAMDEVIDWLTYHNHKRLHSTLGYQPDAVRALALT